MLNRNFKCAIKSVWNYIVLKRISTPFFGARKSTGEAEFVFYYCFAFVPDTPDFYYIAVGTMSGVCDSYSVCKGEKATGFIAVSTTSNGYVVNFYCDSWHILFPSIDVSSMRFAQHDSSAGKKHVITPISNQLRPGAINRITVWMTSTFPGIFCVCMECVTNIFCIV